VDSLLVWLVPKRKTAVMPTMPNCTTTVWRSGTELVLLLVLGQQTVAGSLFCSGVAGENEMRVLDR
jgi:hypothetical protein